MPERARTAETARRLQAVSAIVAAAGSLDELIERLLAAVEEALEVDTVSLLLVGRDRSQLVPRAARGLADTDSGWANARLPIGEGFAGRIAASGRTQAIADLETAKLANPALRQAGIRSLIGAPLVGEEQVIGVIHAGTRSRREFTIQDRALLKLIADRAAVAIERTITHDEFEHIRRLRQSFVASAQELLLPASRAVSDATDVLRPTAHLESGPVQALLERSATLARIASQLVDLLTADTPSTSSRVALRTNATDAVAAVRPVLGQVRIDVDDEEVSTDERALKLIVTNLVDNAIRHGRPPVAVEATIDGRELHLIVTDQGGGFDEQRARALLREPDDTLPAGGLGLAIVHAHARALGGGALYERAAGESAVHVVIPVEQP